MNAEPTTAEVIDALARIEMQRQEREKESGVPVSCNWALGKLYELLPGDRKSPETNAGTPLQANIEAATLAIGRLGKLARLRARALHLRATGHGTSRNPGGMLKKDPPETGPGRR